MDELMKACNRIFLTYVCGMLGLATFVVLALVFIALNLIVDMVYARIDPRVKL